MRREATTGEPEPAPARQARRLAARDQAIATLDANVFLNFSTFGATTIAQ